MWGLLKIGGKVVKIMRPFNDNVTEISLFDVKELYDAAFAEKDKARGNLKTFTRLLEQAQDLEARYRKQEALVEINQFYAKAHIKTETGS